MLSARSAAACRSESDSLSDECVCFENNPFGVSAERSAREWAMFACGSQFSAITLKPAIGFHFKTGKRDLPET